MSEEKTKPKKNRILRFLATFITLVIIFVGGYIYVNQNPDSQVSKLISKVFGPSVPTVIGGNFDLNYKKLPVSSKYVEFNFNTNLDAKTIVPDNFIVSPDLGGKFELVEGNTIKYIFDKKNEVGDQVSFTIKNDILSDKGKALDKEYNYLITISSDLKVLRVNPTKNLNDISQNVSVFFNIPAVPLTTLDGKDKLPCPIEITPKVDGKCIWTTSSVVEFIPKKHFEGATKYEIKIVDKKGLLYPLKDEVKENFETPHLKAYISNSFLPKDGVVVSFNYNVDFYDLRQKINLYLTNKKGKKLDISIEKIKESNSRFIVKLKSGNYKYNTNYLIEIDPGVKPLNGNINLDFRKTVSMKSTDLLSKTEVYRNIYTSTGVLIDTKKYYFGNNDKNKDKIIPKKDIFLKLTFEEEVPNFNNILFIDLKSGAKLKTKGEYVKEEVYNKETGENDLVENKKIIKLMVENELKEDNKYVLKIDKGLNPNLEDHIKREYKTAKKLKVLRSEFVDYSKFCLYLNNPVDNIWSKTNDIIETNPKSKINYISKGQYLGYNDKNKSDAELKKIGLCPKKKSGENLYVISTKLNPNSKYSFNSLSFEDKYGNILEDTFIKEVVTGEIKAKHKYLYNSVYKDISVIPKELPINVNLQTTNLSEAEIDICEMNLDGYKDFLARRWDKGYSPICVNKVREPVVVKNKNWDFSNNIFNLEDDILKSKFSENIIYVRGYKNGSKYMSFGNVYLRENINLVYEKAKGKSLLFTTDFKGNVKTDIALSFYNYDYKNKKYTEIFPKYTLNKQTSVFEVITNDDTNISMIVAKGSEGGFGIVNLEEDSFSNYDFKYISGDSTAKKDYLYLFTERPIYKPGDSVYYKGILRYFGANGYEKSKIKDSAKDGAGAKLELIDDNGKLIKTLEVKIDNNSNFDGEFIIPNDISTGKFSFRFTTGGNSLSNNAHFFIEEYVKPVFKINVESDKKDLTIGEKVNYTIKPEYYFGGIITNTIGNYSVLTQNYFFDAKDYSDYNFGEGYGYYDCIYWGYCNYDDDFLNNKDIEIGSEGLANIVYNFALKKKTPNPSSGELYKDEIERIGEKIYNFSFEVEDPDTKKRVTKYDSVVVHNTDAYVGLKTQNFISKDKSIDVEAIVLDYDAKVLNNKKVKLELYTREWKSVKKQGVDGVFYNDYSVEEKLENSKELSTNNDGLIKYSFKPKKSGEYLVKVIYTGKNSISFTSSKNVYVSGNDYVQSNRDNNSITDLLASKIQTKIGDKVSYILKSPVSNGKALVIIERDDNILDYFIHDIKSNSDIINIDVKSNYYPNYYTKVFLIGEQEGNPLPVFKRALNVTKVNTEFKNLDIKITTNKENYLPAEKVEIEVLVKDNNGKPVENANVFISMVDESLLALKGNPKKNPYAFFYDMKRYLGITTYGSLKNLIEKLEVKDAGDGEKGGSGDQVKGGDSKKKRGNFKDTAFVKANSTTDKNGIAKITIDSLPDNLTTWVIESLVNTPDTKIGVSYDTIVTSKRLILSPNLPSFVTSGDKIFITPVIFNKTGKDQNFKVSISGTNFTSSSQKTKTLKIKSGLSEVASFEIKVDDLGIKNNDGLIKINLKVQSTDKKYIDEIENFIPIKESSTLEAVSTTGKVSGDSHSQQIDLSSLKIKVGKLSLNYSPTLLSQITDGIDYLNSFPYGCSEQITSAIMPNIFIKQLYNSIGQDFDLDKKMISKYKDKWEGYVEIPLTEVIKNYLVDIRKFQKKDGGFVYFYDIKGENYSNFSLTSYILSSASEIRNIGFKLEETVYFDSIKYLKARFYKNKVEGCTITKYNDCTYSEASRLEAIDSILSFSKTDYEAYKMYKLLKTDKFSTTSKLKQAIVIGKLMNLDIQKEEKEALKKQAQEIVNEILSDSLVYNPRGAYIGRSDYYSRLRNTSLLLEAISEVGAENIEGVGEITDNINRWIIGQKKNNSFGSTADNISVIKAITSYLKNSGELTNVNMFAKFKLNGDLLDEKKIDDSNKLEIFSKSLELSKLKDNNDFVVNKSGNGNIYYDLNMSYYLNSKDIKPRDEGFFVDRNYYSYLEYKNISNLKDMEWENYQKGDIGYEDLKYPKSVYEYIKPVTSGKVGDLLIVKNKLVVSETRDKVAYEGFIPAGAEIINPHLSTSTVIAKEFNNSRLFDRDEYRLDRYFAYANNVYPGIHEFSFLIRLTHKGSFNIRPSRASEFYNVEVFGRSEGNKFVVVE